MDLLRAASKVQYLATGDGALDLRSEPKLGKAFVQAGEARAAVVVVTPAQAADWASELKVFHLDRLAGAEVLLSDASASS